MREKYVLCTRTIGTDLAGSSVRCHAGLRSAFVAAVLQADNFMALR